jgi:NET1-associated nuclear protein 1 (U3 small nucleolar RNA-associated protein 17)
MASALKRKRGSVEVLETPKRAKSVKQQKLANGHTFVEPVNGWDPAFNPPPNIKELVQTNGVNGDDINGMKEDSPEAIDYEDLAEWNIEEKKKRREIQRQERALLKSFQKPEPIIWKISEPIGGRMINVDPVFTTDEKYATRTSILGMC